MADLNQDWRESLSLSISHRVRFVVVGGHAMAVHGKPRMTEDLDVFVEASRANARRLRRTLVELGFGEAAPDGRGRGGPPPFDTDRGVRSAPREPFGHRSRTRKAPREPSHRRSRCPTGSLRASDHRSRCPEAPREPSAHRSQCPESSSGALCPPIAVPEKSSGALGPPIAVPGKLLGSPRATDRSARKAPREPSGHRSRCPGSSSGALGPPIAASG
jgi:hypothetical protein